MMDRVVLCMKWGTLYPASYVNVLYNAVRRHLAGEFRFVCLTDRAEGLAPAIEAFPIPDLGVPGEDWKRGGWPKLGVFLRDLYGLSGRALFIDLDTVICGDLQPFFDDPAPFVAIDTGPTWGRGAKDAPPLCGTGIFAFTLGAHPEVVEAFQADPHGAIAAHRLEQVFVQHMIPGMKFWPLEWVLSFKYHIRRPPLVGLILPPRAPRPQDRIIAFHGDPRPVDLVRGGLWGVFPHLGFGKVAWMVDYWRQNGGFD